MPNGFHITGFPLGNQPPLSEDDFSDLETSSAQGATGASPAATATKSEVSFISGLLCRFLDWMCGKFGEQMTSKQVGKYLDAVFPEDDWPRNKLFIKATTQTEGSNPSDESENAAQELTYRECTSGDDTMIITDPCHDMPVGTPRSKSRGKSDFSVAECLREICTSHPTGSLIVQIPVSQSNRHGLSDRDHFALLNASIRDGVVTSAKLIDSKEGLLDLSYGGAKHLLEQFGKTRDLKLDPLNNFAIETIYLADQSLINHTDCGRFTVKHAVDFFDSLDPLSPDRQTEETPSYRAIDNELFVSWCKRTEHEVQEATERNAKEAEEHALSHDPTQRI